MSVSRVTQPSAQAQAPQRIGVAMAVIMTGVLMTAVDTTIVVLALPEIQRGLHVALSAVVWVIISFLLVITLLATQVGRLGDMFGRVRMYEMGFAVFVLGSLACGLAWNEASIIVFRVVQGVGGAFIMANSGAVIMYLQGPRGLSPIHASLLLVPGYIFGSVVGPYAGRLADRRGPVLPATAGLAIQVVSLAIYAQLTMTTGLWVVVLASIINGIGASFFFPANSSAVMKAAPPESFGVSSGMLRTFANIGMVFSFAVAILIASRSISRGLAFAIFVGSTSLHGALAVAFTSGLHAAFYASMGFMALAAALSALRARRS